MCLLFPLSVYANLINVIYEGWSKSNVQHIYDHEISFVQSSLPKYCRPQTVTGDVPPPVHIKLQIFYLILRHRTLQILISVMIASLALRVRCFFVFCFFWVFFIDWLTAYYMYDVILFWSRDDLLTSPFTNQQMRSE